MPAIKKIRLREKFSSFSEHWTPKILIELHGVALKAVKLKGEFDWHQHEREDEIFWVRKGKLIIHFRNQEIELTEGELLLIPHEVEHKPEAPKEVEVVLIEPTETLNTGNIRTEKTVEKLKKI